MNLRWRLILTTAVVGVVVLTLAWSRLVAEPPGRVPRGTPASTSEASAGGAAVGPTAIGWFATLDSGLREAKRTNRPILLVAAAPHCAGVSGMW
jgi:hypothetical protein